MIDSGPSGTISQAEATFTFHGTPGDTAKLELQARLRGLRRLHIPEGVLRPLRRGPQRRVPGCRRGRDADRIPGNPQLHRGRRRPLKTARIGRPSVRGPDKVDQGRKVTFKVAIPNTGDAAATGVRLRVSGGGVSLEKQVGQVAADKTKNVKVRVKFSQSGRKSGSPSGSRRPTPEARRPGRRSSSRSSGPVADRLASEAGVTCTSKPTERAPDDRPRRLGAELQRQRPRGDEP